MKNLKKSAEIVGQVFGLLIGDKFATPVQETLRKHPNLSLSTSPRLF